MDNPDALTERIMSSLPDLEPSLQDEDRPRITSIRWHWMAVAASLLLVIGIGVTLMPTSLQEATSPLVAKVEQKPLYTPKTVQSPNAIEQNTVRQNDKSISKQLSMGKPQSLRRTNSKSVIHELPVRPERTQSSPADKKLHYAALTDTAYQDPARVDEFIANLSTYNGVEAVVLDCNSGDSAVVSKAYVFDDTKELNLFGRLLQVACWYDSKTPGYLLNFTHQQLYFTLKDLRKGQKYLWIAERINGNRILLQSTRTTIGVVSSTPCYQDYRSKLIQSGIHNQQNI